MPSTLLNTTLLKNPGWISPSGWPVINFLLHRVDPEDREPTRCVIREKLIFSEQNFLVVNHVHVTHFMAGKHIY